MPTSWCTTDRSDPFDSEDLRNQMSEWESERRRFENETRRLLPKSTTRGVGGRNKLSASRTDAKCVLESARSPCYIPPSFAAVRKHKCKEDHQDHVPLPGLLHNVQSSVHHRSSISDLSKVQH
jgi:hypothetical protein